MGWTEAEPETLVVLLALVRGLRPRYVIETGTYQGATARAIGENLETGELATLEIDEYNVERATEAVKGLPVTVHLCSSLVFTPDRPVDLMFLDSGVETRVLELEHFRPFLAPEAVVTFHDSRDIHPPLDGWRWVNLPTARGLLLLQADA